MKINEIHSLLLSKANANIGNGKLFFKTNPGDYAHHDKFLGVSVPTVREIARQYKNLDSADIKKLLQSPFNEERLLALIILTLQYSAADNNEKERLYQLYIDHLDSINNWNLVDASAHLIIGAHIWKKDKDFLQTLAHSDNLWHKRIAIVATWYFIKNNDNSWTFIIAQKLLSDTHDLIHKAVGWMLREAGKRNETELKIFLDKHAHYMPRTMLRYAIEKLPENVRKNYLLKKF